MKKVALLVTLLAVVGMASWAYADLSSSAVAKVLINVNPNVAVNVSNVPPPVNIQGGLVAVTVTFQVEGNTQAMSLFVEASDLYKGTKANSEVPPIVLEAAEGAVIEPSDATPMNAGSNTAAFTGPGAPVGDFATQLSESILFESSQNNHFSQPVDVTVTWNQSDPEKPQGQYGGYVRLTALVQPTGTGG
jgi:hypothetical protein